MRNWQIVQNILDSLHSLYLKFRHAAPALFFFVLFILIFQSPKVFGGSVVAGVPTPVKVVFDGQEKSFMATQNTIEGALVQGGIDLRTNDITEPPLKTNLTGQRIEINVIRALPVLISDNNQEYLAYSAYTNELDILKQLKIEIYPEDKVSSELILDPADENAVGQKVIIMRAPVYKIFVDGTEKSVRSWSQNVTEVIKKSGVILGPQDQISPSVSMTLNPGQDIIITRINEFDMSIDEEIPFETVNRGDASVPFGQKRVTQEGINGVIKKTYHVVYKNGQEVSRWLIGSELITPKQNKIIASGIITGRANFGYYSGMVTSFYKGMTGRYLLVTNLANGRQVKVRIIGSGPFNGPILDLGVEPFKAIGGNISSGYIPQVSVQLVN
jgi:uncharacterized protein YabE (DUF348 family)